MNKKTNLAIIVFLPLCINANNQDTLMLDEIKVVSATGFEQNIKDAPASISVITQKELSKRNYRDLSMMIKDLPGNFSGNFGAAYRQGISLRGLGQKYTKVLIDGKSANQDNAYRALRAVGSNQSALPPASAISHIEVIRGPMSSLYGSDAMGGVINIITKGFSNEPFAQIDGYYTLAKREDISNDYSGGFYASGAIVDDLLGIQIYSNYKHKLEDKIWYGNRRQEDINLGTKFIYIPSSNDQISFGFNTSKVNYDRTYGKTRSHPRTNMDTAHEEAKTYGINLNHRSRYDKFTIDSYVNYDYIKEEGNGPASQNLNLQTLTLDTKGSYFWDNSTLTLGLNFKTEKLDEKGTKLFDSVNLQRWDYSVYGENDFYITDNFAITSGLRYNYDKDYGGHLAPRIYALYKAGDNFTFKGGVSAGYSTPDIKMRTDNLAIVIASGGGAQIGHSYLKPETSLSYEISTSYDNDRLNLNATAFYTEFKNILSTNMICRPSHNKPCLYKGHTYIYGIWDSVNVGKADIAGIELSGDYRITDNLKLHANYTHTKSKQKTGPNKGKSINNQPVNIVKIGVDYDLNDRLNLWAQGNYYGKTLHSSYKEDVASYTLLDIGANYQITKNTSVNATIFNALNEKALITQSVYKLYAVDGLKAQIGFKINF